MTPTRLSINTDGKRLRASLRQRIQQNRALAWRTLPLLILFFMGILSFGISFNSRLGEQGLDTLRMGQNTSFESTEIIPTPTSEASPPMPMPKLEPITQELSSNVEVETPPSDIKIKEIAEIESLQLETTSDSSPLVNLGELAVPEPTEAQPQERTSSPQKKSQSGSSPAQASTTSQSKLGQSSSKAAGRISVSYKNATQPPYPARLRASRTSGTVLVCIQVDSQGNPQSVSIKQSSGFKEFDDTAQSWILHRWSFNPAKENGKAVPSIVTTSIHFVYGNHG